MSSSATKVDSCSSGSTIGPVFEDWTVVGEVMCEDLHMVNVAHGGGSVHVWGGISYMEKSLLVCSGSDVTGSRLSPSYGGTLGSTWQDMVSQQLATGS